MLVDFSLISCRSYCCYVCLSFRCNQN